MDAISVIGCGIGVWALLASGTSVGLPLGAVLGLVSFTLVLTAQLLKWLRAFNNKTEDVCKQLNGESLAQGGMERFEQWFEEFNQQTVALPLTADLAHQQAAIGDLLKRVDEFITDWDTYDQVTEIKA